jgi:hypothetical protein
MEITKGSYYSVATRAVPRAWKALHLATSW